MSAIQTEKKQQKEKTLPLDQWMIPIQHVLGEMEIKVTEKRYQRILKRREALKKFYDDFPRFKKPYKYWEEK